MKTGAAAQWVLSGSIFVSLLSFFSLDFLTIRLIQLLAPVTRAWHEPRGQHSLAVVGVVLRDLKEVEVLTVMQ
ncbi:MAG: hypothetical protein EA424_26440 [Planctomycetaceae bacterium]|nr:MAG: hypothetical protein EA424_26440 [Planctomycetaceae bacterium]